MPLGFRVGTRHQVVKDLPFVEFLQHVKIEDVNDEGEAEGIIPFEPWEYLIRAAEHWDTGADDCVLKARQLGFCLDPSTRILTADLLWRRIDSLRAGDEVVAVDEHAPIGRGTARKMRTAIVQAAVQVVRKAYRITFADGRAVVCTGQHPWLSRKSGSIGPRWRAIEARAGLPGRLKVGTLVRSVTRPWDDPTVEDGWFGGMLDGEGSISKRSAAAGLNVSQREGPVWDRLVRYCQDRGYNHCIEGDQAERLSKYGKVPVPKIAFGRMDEMFRLLGQTRPTRFIQNRFWEGRELPGKRQNGHVSWTKITRIEELGTQAMVDLQTSTGTYIAEGFVSHNTTLFAAYAVKHMRARRRRVLYIADTEAKAFMMIDRMKLIISELPTHLRPKIYRQSKGTMVFQNGSEIMALASSSRSGRGWQASLVGFDEAAHHQNARANYTGIRSSMANGGQMIVMSSPIGPGGWFAQYYKQQQKNGDSTRFVAWFERPGHDQEWYEREAAKYVGEREFKYENPATEQEAFDAPEGLVFPMFSRERHVGLPPVAYEDCMWRFAGVDIGGEDPTAIGIYGLARIEGPGLELKRRWKLIQYDQFYRKGDVTTEDVTDYLLRWHQRARFFRVRVGEPPKSPIIGQMTKLGLPAMGAKGDPRIRNLCHKRFLERDLLLIDPKCREFIREYENYRVKKRTDPNTKEEYESGAVDHHGDGIDVAGMVMLFAEGAIRATGGGQKHKLKFHKPQGRPERGPAKNWGQLAQRRR